LNCTEEGAVIPFGVIASHIDGWSAAVPVLASHVMVGQQRYQFADDHPAGGHDVVRGRYDAVRGWHAAAGGRYDAVRGWYAAVRGGTMRRQRNAQESIFCPQHSLKLVLLGRGLRS
jgi:hypothetical protein